MKFLFLFLFIFIPFFSKGEFKIPEKPNKIYSIIDYAKVLNNEEKFFLKKKLKKYKNITSIKIIIIILKKLHEEDINFIAAKWGEKWGIGKKKEDNGIIILISVDDKKISIQNGYGIEPYLTDALSNRIIKKNFIPFLKKKKYFESINYGIDSIFDIFKNKNIKNIYINKNQKKYLIFFNFLLFCLFFYFFYKKEKNYFSFRYLLYNNIIFYNINEIQKKLEYLNENDEEDDEDDEDDENLGEGGSFGGGGASGNW